MKIATPARHPRKAICCSDTGLLPLGAGTCVHVVATAERICMKKHVTPKRTGFASRCEMPTRTPAIANHVVREIKHMKASDAKNDQLDGMYGGANLHTTKNSDETRVPPGTVNVDASRKGIRASWGAGPTIAMPAMRANPKHAGTTVVGHAAMSPPFCPPKNSIARVAMMATMNAKQPEKAAVARSSALMLAQQRAKYKQYTAINDPFDAR